MSNFYYKAKQGPQKIVDGIVDAPGLTQAISQLSQMGLVPIDVYEATDREYQRAKKKDEQADSFVRFGRTWTGVHLSDIVLFTRQMSDLIAGSVPILRSLEIVLKQTRNVVFRTKIQKIHESVRDGVSLSEALAQQKNLFSAFYVNMIRSGELSGNLAVSLERLADLIEQQQETRGKIWAALAYPLFILGTGFLTVVVLLTFVIPRLTVIFEDFDQTLPWPTVVLIKTSDFLAAYWWIVLIVLGGVAITVNRRINTPDGRAWIDRQKLKIPLIGMFIQYQEISRFARTLGVLVEGGVPVPLALASTKDIVANVILRQEIAGMHEMVVNGMSLRGALQKCRFFPEQAASMISVGEESGNLERAFFKIAQTYERSADRMSKTALSLLGPAVLLVIVGFVGFLVVAMLLPIFRMNMVLQ